MVFETMEILQESLKQAEYNNVLALNNIDGLMPGHLINILYDKHSHKYTWSFFAKVEHASSQSGRLCHW